jgi:hypothetical protein
MMDKLSESDVSFLKSISVLQIPTLNIQNFLSQLNDDDVKDYDDYSNLYKIRHDLIHRLICEYRSIPFGEKPIHESLTDNGLTIQDNDWELVMMQSPDIVIINERTINITEITISRSDSAERNKISKYSLLCHILRKNGLTVNVEIIVFLPDPRHNNPFDLASEHKLSSAMVNRILEVLEYFHNVFATIHTKPYGQSWYTQFHELLGDKEVLPFDQKKCEEIYNNQKNKTFHSDKDFKDFLEDKPVHDHLTKTDEDFLNHVVELSLTMDLKLNKSEKDLIDVRAIVNKKSNSNHLRSFFPLPYIKILEVDSAIRTTWEDDIEVTKILGEMQLCDDDILSTIGFQMKGSIGRVSLTRDQKARIALHGPGRKRYITKGSADHLQAHLNNKMYSLCYDVDLTYITELSFILSRHNITEETTTDLNRDLNSIMSMRSLGLDYVKICQSIFREVNINSLRKDRNKNFILKPTGVRGVFVLIYPGPKLRTGEKKSLVWFKVIIRAEYGDINDPLYMSRAFKEIFFDKGVWSSNWISTDVNRLDHYIRCYDKILMAYSAYSHSSRETTLIDSMKMDSSNALGLIIMIYMEDKRSTSTMLQDVRYIVMSELSIYKYTNKILDKMITNMRTPLQLYLLKQVIKFIKNMREKKISELVEFGMIVFDNDTQTFLDNKSGADITIPRVFTIGDQITFKQILCEMYFTMLFNKNQDDQTHSSFQILTKMLEGEASLLEIKSRGLHLGYHPETSIHEDAEHLIKNPHTSQFSRVAIEIGSILQSKDRNCTAKGGLAHTNAQLKSNLNKAIDEFATYKSSAIDTPTKYDPFKKPENTRRRCIEGCLDLHSRGYTSSFDIGKDIDKYPTIFHIFKKNQIGGVREILILTIEKRIAINVLETFSRNICKQDDREMLTHGNSKFEKIRDMQRSLKVVDGKRLIVHFNFDKSRWGPSFMPIQFIYLFSRFRKLMPTYFNYFLALLSQHHNKVCVLPAPLIRAWSLDPDNLYQHQMDKNLQRLKEKFLKDFDMSFVNESNMGQGILHYTSSLLHLCLLSFRDEIFKRLLKRFNIPCPDWVDVVSSDDSLTSLSIEMRKGNASPLTFTLFLRATEVSERLFNCWTSTTKSSISLIINEFNSVFGSNLTSYPTLFKFALASVQPLSTDSFYRMVKESYNSSRQLFENGSSLELFLLSHKLNKNYCEQIYHTHPGGQNDLENYNIRYGYAPYHVGYYPIGDPTLMLMFGPEYHNYELFIQKDSLNDSERKLFLNSHKIIKDDMIHSMASLMSSETTLGGLLRIEAAIGPSKRLLRIRKTLKWDRKVIQDMICDDPMLLFRRIKKPDETYLRMCMKLFQGSASEALRTTTASIYYGRVAASVSANAFYIPNSKIYDEEDKADEGHKEKLTTTYLDCFHKIMNEKTFEDIEHLHLIYPHMKDYLQINKLSKPRLVYSKRDPFQTMNVRKLLCVNNESRMLNPVYLILEKFWSAELRPDLFDNKLKRDWVTIKKACPVIKETLSETLSLFNGDHHHKLSGLLLILMRLHTLSDKKIKAFCYGPSTYLPKDTYFTIMINNYRQNSTTTIGGTTVNINERSTDNDLLCMIHNYHILRTLSDDKWDQQKLVDFISTTGLDLDDIDHAIGSPDLTPQIRKRFVFTVFSILSRPLPQWTSLTGVVAHKWIIRQKFTSSGWRGRFSLLLQLGLTKVRVDGDKYGISIYNDYNDDLTALATVLKRSLELLDIKEENLINLAGAGQWVLVDDKCIPTISNSGFKIHHETINDIDFGVCHVTINQKVTTLCNSDNEKIYSMTSGLLRTNSLIRIEPQFDFMIYGLRFSQLLALGAFKEVWDVCQFDKKDLLKYTHDLIIDRPTVSEETVARFAEVDFNMVDENEYELLDLPAINKRSSEPLELNTDVKEEPFDMSVLMVDLDSVFIQNFESFDTFFTTNDTIKFVNELNSVKPIQKTRSLWIRVKNLKYFILANMVTSVYKINNKTIDNLRKLGAPTEVIWSCIKCLDIMRQGSTISPKGTNIQIDSDFEEEHFNKC